MSEVRRLPGGVAVRPVGAEAERFDAAVLATHSDQALRMLAQPREAEAAVLSDLGYQANEVVLHTDPGVMPRRPLAWARWNAHLPANGTRPVACEDEPEPVQVTYHLDRLQGVDTPTPFFATLNRASEVDPATVQHRALFHHPVFSQGAAAARERWGEIDGVGGVHYCGAYWGNGFHEDGVISALRVCERLGVAV